LEHIMDWKIEMIPVPVTDVDRAKDFYANKVGLPVDFDHSSGENFRIVQLTPPGSGCSIVVGEGVVPDMVPGTLHGLQLVVADIHRAHAELVERGVEVSEVQSVDGDADKVRQGGPALDNVGFVFFQDPDGNGWAVQQISARG
jgi:catechol 2,3-dioxygenase-like lactoylglutathione lyase family enzyme